MSASWDGQRRQRLLELLLGGYETKRPLRHLAKQAGLKNGLFPDGGDLRSVCHDLIERLANAKILDDFVRCAANDVRLSGSREALLDLLFPEVPEQKPPDRVLTDNERARLTDLIDQWDKASRLPDESDVAVLVWTALGHIGRVELRACRSVPMMISLLDQRMHALGAMPAILLFLEHLLAHPDIAVSEERPILRRLIDDVAQRTRVAPENRGPTAAAGEILGQVMVYLELLDEDGHLRPEALVYRQTGKSYFVYQCVDAFPDWQEAAEQAITEIAPLLRRFDPGQIRFEIVVPWRLLGEPMDECLFAGAELGSQFEVTIRLGERRIFALYERRWERRSRLLHDRGDTPAEHLVRVVTPDARPGTVLRPGRPTDESVAVMIFSAVHHPPRTLPTRHVLLDAFREGVPVFLWFRGDQDPSQLHDLVKSMLSGAELNGIPAAVRARRHPSEPDDSDGAAAGQPISVIYDDFGTRPRRGGSLQPARARGGTQ
ncbi:MULTISPECIES: effector-associated domain EAD1-containing protein [unclassified Actinoplanes]|uniref:VMAP-C domain-containing protein n=1 Tax=unclassified Actinoplanes TaxID=2626549 RepID=UPI0012F81CF1|nr:MULTISPECIES: effector-associated domain EAD1-containing protein [unclassified Actinoplanes]